MAQPCGYSCDQLSSDEKSNVLMGIKSSDWTDVAPQNYGDQANNVSLWSALTQSGMSNCTPVNRDCRNTVPFSEQKTGTPRSNWHIPNESIMHPGHDLFGFAAVDPFAVVWDDQSAWVPRGNIVEPERGFQSAMINNQVDDGLPWFNNRPEQQREQIPIHHDQTQVAVENAPHSREPPFEDDDDSNLAIGTVLNNGTFKCSMMQCATKSFKRTAELRRHYNTTHAVDKPEFWCQVQLCNRSVAFGGQPFHRKYRLQDHMRKIHGRDMDMDVDGDEELAAWSFAY